MNLLVRLFSCLLFLSVLSWAVSAEVFTAVTHMENLLTAEGEVIGAMSRYLASEEQRLVRLRRFLADYERFHSDASNTGREKFLANPVNAFLIVKKLTRDWGQVQTVMNENHAQVCLTSRVV
jgi:prolyl 4-hydroxylase